MAKRDERVRRLGGGLVHMDVALSTAVGRQMGAQLHSCTLYALQAVMEGYAEVYVEGVHYHPLGRYKEFMRNGSMHAWCVTKDRRLVDPSLNGYTVGPGYEEWLAAYEFTPLGVLTRAELRRAAGHGGEDAVNALVKSLRYAVPEGVAPFVDGPVTLESMEKATVAAQRPPSRECCPDNAPR